MFKMLYKLGYIHIVFYKLLASFWIVFLIQWVIVTLKFKIIIQLYDLCICNPIEPISTEHISYWSKYLFLDMILDITLYCESLSPDCMYQTQWKLFAV